MSNKLIVPYIVCVVAFSVSLHPVLVINQEIKLIYAWYYCCQPNTYLPTTAVPCMLMLTSVDPGGSRAAGILMLLRAYIQGKIVYALNMKYRGRQGKASECNDGML
jgi:hypothetical protein